MTISVKDLYIKVWRFREEAEPYWPTPNPANSMRFAFREVGEALDAWIDVNHPEFRRNNPKPADPEEILNELTDTSLMLLTALGPGTPINKVDGIPANVDLDGLCTWVSDAWAAYRQRRSNPTRWKTQCIAIVTAIGQYPGMDLEERLDRRLSRIRAKHMPEQIAA